MSSGARVLAGRVPVRTTLVALAALAALVGVMAASGSAAPGGTTGRVSVDSSGNQGNNHSIESSISSDGRYVAFKSAATNLVAGDTNADIDVFLRDREAGTTERVSVSSSGNQANGGSHHPSVSSDGRYVVYTSPASNLVTGDTNDRNDIFLRERLGDVPPTARRRSTPEIRSVTPRTGTTTVRTPSPTRSATAGIRENATPPR